MENTAIRDMLGDDYERFQKQMQVYIDKAKGLLEAAFRNEHLILITYDIDSKQRKININEVKKTDSKSHPTKDERREAIEKYCKSGKNKFAMLSESCYVIKTKLSAEEVNKELMNHIDKEKDFLFVLEIFSEVYGHQPDYSIKVHGDSLEFLNQKSE